MMLTLLIDQAAQRCCALSRAGRQKAGRLKFLWKEIRSFFPRFRSPGPGKLSTCPSHFPAPAPRANSTIRPDIGHHPGTTLQPPANRWPYSQSLTNRRVGKGGLPMNALKFQKNIRVFGDSRKTCELVDAAVVDVAGHNGLSPDEWGRSHACSSRSPVPESNGAGSSRGVIKPSSRGGLSQMRWPRAGREQIEGPPRRGSSRRWGP